MKQTFFAFLLLTSFNLVSQSILVQGLITDSKNNRQLDEVEVYVFDTTDEGVVTSTFSNSKGAFIIHVPNPGMYIIRFERQAYIDSELIVEITDDIEFLKIQMTRLPGYEFEGTIRELISYSNGILGKELKNVKIEVFNNTISKELIVIEDDPDNTFKVNFERGNHYTLLLRKKGYFAKRIEVFVDTEGCLLCFEGLGTYSSPEIESALSNNNERGSIISDIPLKKIIQDESIVLENIYYDYNKWNIRKDATPPLDNLVRILKRNPIVIELGSHTDSRGIDEFNMDLSQKRASSAVDYIVARGIKASRITFKGYGETHLINHCSDNVTCSDVEHQKNRRTEFKVTAFMEESNFDQKTLKEILTQEKTQGKRLNESIKIMDNNE